MKKKLVDRYLIFAFFLIVFIAVIVSQLVGLQIINGKENDEKSQQRILRERKVNAQRGNITDRNGIPIATNRLGFSVQMVKTKITEAERNFMFVKLVDIFNKNNEDFKKDFTKYLTFAPIGYGTSLKTEAAIAKWKKEMANKPADIDIMDSPESIFKYFRMKFMIEDSYSDEDAYKIMLIKYEILIKQYDYINPLNLANDVSLETVAEIEEKNLEFPGVTTEMESFRKYVDAEYAAHVIGYVGGMREEDYPTLKAEGYAKNDILGQDGVEKAAEKYLRGKDGLKTIEVNTNGRLIEELDANPAVPGNDVTLTIDYRLQKIAMESLERTIAEIRVNGGLNNYGDANAGAAVALDLKTGEVLVLASYPSYDPAAFLLSNNQEVSDLISGKIENKPLFNRAISGTYAPGSTFKPLTAIAALEEGIITANTPINDPGYYIADGISFPCMETKYYGYNHGTLTLTKALATSCNVYFHDIGVKTGIDLIDKWAKLLGLGEKTGIDILNEVKGTRSSKDFKKTLTTDFWGRADTAQTAIGQLYNAFTPLQLANYIATIANGGKRFTPYIIKKVTKHDGSTVVETQPQFEQLPVSVITLEAVKAGLVEVAQSVEGTAAASFQGFPYKVAGKTGTAETGPKNQSSNALFICYAPVEDPQIAIAVVIERGAWGSYAAPIARDILTEYFNLNTKSGIDDKIMSEEVQFTR